MALEIKNVSRTFEGSMKETLKDISLSVEQCRRAFGLREIDAAEYYCRAGLSDGWRDFPG